MVMRGSLRDAVRAAVVGSVVLGATMLPYTLTVDWNQPVTPLPPASTALFIFSSVLLGAAGCMLRLRETRTPLPVPPQT